MAKKEFFGFGQIVLFVATVFVAVDDADSQMVAGGGEVKSGKIV